MTLRLIVTRHAKSSWGDPLCDDFDRVLNTRGRTDAEALGRWLADSGYHPDEVLVSAAARTLETWARMGTALPPPTSVQPIVSLYHASSDQILRQLQRAQGKTVLLIAHNPGIGDFAERFAIAPAPHADFRRYPTGATTVFDVDAPTWRQAAFAKNTVADFVVPRDLSA